MGSTIGEENKKVLQTDGGVRKGGQKTLPHLRAVVRRSAITQRDVRSLRLPEEARRRLAICQDFTGIKGPRSRSLRTIARICNPTPRADTTSEIINSWELTDCSCSSPLQTKT